MIGVEMRPESVHSFSSFLANLAASQEQHELRSYQASWLTTSWSGWWMEVQCVLEIGATGTVTVGRGRIVVNLESLAFA